MTKNAAIKIGAIKTYLFNDSAASWALSPTNMLTSDTASETDDDEPDVLLFRGADSPDDDIQLSIVKRGAVLGDI